MGGGGGGKAKCAIVMLSSCSASDHALHYYAGEIPAAPYMTAIHEEVDMTEIHEEVAAAAGNSSSSSIVVVSSSSSSSTQGAAAVPLSTACSVVDLFEPGTDIDEFCFHTVIMMVMCAPCLPLFVLDFLVGGCCLKGIRKGAGARKQSVTFDRKNRVVVLRDLTRLGCSSSFTLVREQSIHFDAIDSFKCAKSEKWIDASGHVLLVAVKRPLGVQQDGGLPQAAASRAAGAHHGPPYQWPAFIDRGIFDGGDLLPLDYQFEGGRRIELTIPECDDINVHHTIVVHSVIERLIHVAADLNSRLGVSA